MDVQLVYATFPDRASAEDVAGTVLEDRLAACVTYWEAGTRYWWEGEIEEADETLALFKTAPDKRDALVEALEAEHPYEVPCVLPLASEGGPDGYAEWVQAQATGGRGAPAEG